MVRRIEVLTDDKGVVFAVSIPSDFAPKGYFPIVPVAHLVVSVPGDTPQSLDVGITFRTLAAIVTLAAVLLAGWAMYRFAIYLGVPGPRYDAAPSVGGAIISAVRGFSVPLRIISSAKGWASLSQFQMMLWTFVIGAGAVYVVTLTGTLIPISTGTLELLGIAGLAAVATEVKATQQQQASPPPSVLELRTVGPALATEILVSWLPPASGTAATSYIVQYADPAAPDEWRYAASELPSTGFRIVGLAPKTAYRVRVLARNAAGNSAEATVPAPTADVAPVTPSVANLHVQPGSVTDATVKLEWYAPPSAAPDAFVVEMRKMDSDDPWDGAPGPVGVEGTTRRIEITGLTPTTRYNFRVRLKAQSDAWANFELIKTRPLVRTPRWSDIVTDTDRPAQIDVTRVQMLFFTVISAFFVALKIINTGLIPEIDQSYVALMGISNGVYVTAKFVRN